MLYVAYAAHNRYGSATGYVIFKNRKEPKNKQDIDDIIEEISETEDVHQVIPLFWREITEK
jgi:hypothetical protein